MKSDAGARTAGETRVPPGGGAVTVASMEVTFTKVAGRRYPMTVIREPLWGAGRAPPTALAMGHQRKPPAPN